MVEIGMIQVIAVIVVAIPVIAVIGVSGTFALDAMKNLFALHGDALGRVDAQSHLIAFDAQHCHRDLVPDHYRFTHSTRQDKHLGEPPLTIRGLWAGGHAARAVVTGGPAAPCEMAKP